MFVKCSRSVEIIFSAVGTAERLADLVRRSQVRHQVLLGFVDAITELTDKLKQKMEADSVIAFLQQCALRSQDFAIYHREYIRI